MGRWDIKRSDGHEGKWPFRILQDTKSTFQVNVTWTSNQWMETKNGVILSKSSHFSYDSSCSIWSNTRITAFSFEAALCIFLLLKCFSSIGLLVQVITWSSGIGSFLCATVAGVGTRTEGSYSLCFEWADKTTYLWSSLSWLDKAGRDTWKYILFSL